MNARSRLTTALTLVLVAIAGAVVLLSMSPRFGATATNAIEPGRAQESFARASVPTRGSASVAAAMPSTATPEPPESTPSEPSEAIAIPVELDLTPEPTSIATPEPLPTRDIAAMLGIDPKPLVCANAQGKLQSETVPTKILARALPVQVWLPPCYDPERKRYPVLYLMHGNGVAQGGWVDREHVNVVANDLVASGAIPPFIIVMPASDIDAGNASRFNYSTSGKGTWEDMFVHELLPFIERKYSTWTNREGRAIGGISRGGFWSIEIGLANPDKFSIIGGHSPSIYQFLVGVKPNFTMLQYTSSLDEVRAQRIWLDAGDSDWARTDAARLSKDLTDQEIDHIFTIGKGGHDDRTWAARADEYLAFYSLDWPYEPADK